MARDDQGKPYTVRYEAVNAMLLNEFLKEHRKVLNRATQDRGVESDRGGTTVSPQSAGGASPEGERPA